MSSEGEEKVEVSVHENHVAFFIGETTINSRLLEGPFPNYKQVIPKDNDKELIVDREILTSAVRRVAVLADTLTHQVRMTLSKKKIELVVSTPDVGEAREEMDRAIAELPETLRSTFVLRDIQGLSGAETAEILGITVQAVKNRLHRARLRLRDRLSDYFAERIKGLPTVA